MWRAQRLPSSSYQAAMETSLVEDPAWCSRLSLGLGKTALALGHPEIAMASLQEAAQADPSNPQIQHALAEAYEAGSLLSNALQAARITLRLDPDNVDTLVWFARKAIQWTSPENGGQPDSLPGRFQYSDAHRSRECPQPGHPARSDPHRFIGQPG